MWLRACVALGMGKPANQVAINHPFANNKIFKDHKTVSWGLEQARNESVADQRRGNIFVFDWLMKRSVEVTAA